MTLVMRRVAALRGMCHCRRRVISASNTAALCPFGAVPFGFHATTNRTEAAVAWYPSSG